MPSIALISHGHLHFLVPAKISAAKLLETLSLCEIVEWDHEGGESFYKPSERQSDWRLKLEFIDSKKLRYPAVKSKPERKVRRLEGGA